MLSLGQSELVRPILMGSPTVTHAGLMSGRFEELNGLRSDLSQGASERVVSVDGLWLAGFTPSAFVLDSEKDRII